ncbi:MAG: 30S ribosomal protein S7 [Candidatus Omnitrophota bacterium]|nr:30S ribosomal protein S7 [Candidatus Omnitrophota bacterium]
MRRQKAPRREVKPDTKYNDKLVGRFISILINQGKKSLAEKIVYHTLDIVTQKMSKQDPVEIFKKAVDNARPLLEVKSRRVGGATYQVPIEVSSSRGIVLALRWMKNFANTKKGKPMEQKLADEIISAYKKEGSVIKKREDTHRMAEANKAFAHYRW